MQGRPGGVATGYQWALFGSGIRLEGNGGIFAQKDM